MPFSSIPARSVLAFCQVLLLMGLAACHSRGGPSAVSISVPLAVVGEPYSHRITLDAAGNVTASTNLPPWLTATTVNGFFLELSGTPTDPEVRDFEVIIADANEPRTTTYRIHLEVLDPSIVNLTGNWLLTVDVITASGVCAGEENDPPSTHPVAITQSGTAVLLAGVQGSMQNTLMGALFPATVPGSLATLELTGSVVEVDGTTNITYYLDVLGTNDIQGGETWQWTGTVQSCTGTSIVTLVRVP